MKRSVVWFAVGFDIVMWAILISLCAKISCNCSSAELVIKPIKVSDEWQHFRNFYRDITSYETDKIVNAIWLAEGGDKTKRPYGIKIRGKIFTKEQARVLCENTVRNNFNRWQSSGKAEDFITFLGNRYCPRNIDPEGNKNWIANVGKLVRKK